MDADTLQKNNGTWAQDNGAVRVEDYLNDKLQTYADLENIDVLLRNVLDQQDLLKQQVSQGLACKFINDLWQAS